MHEDVDVTRTPGAVAGEPTVRVQQLAATLRQPVPQVVEQLRAAGLQVRAGSDRLTYEETAQALQDVDSAVDPSHARPLIIEAFAAARDTEREGWAEMTLAVLKNRLLDVTKRGFNEADYGAPTFGYFASLFPGLLSIRVSETGSVMVSIDPQAVPRQPALPGLSVTPTRQGRIRDDLWTGFADFASAEVYVWDVKRGLASIGESGEDKIAIPTLTASEESGWRADFFDALAGDATDAETQVVSEWRDKRLPTVSLPPRLRSAWNGVLRTRMLNKIERFFTDQGLSLPEDLLVLPDDSDQHRGSRTQSANAAAAAASPLVSTAELRAIIQRCVAVMTDGELRALSLPVHVLLRATGRQ